MVVDFAKLKSAIEDARGRLLAEAADLVEYLDDAGAPPGTLVQRVAALSGAPAKKAEEPATAPDFRLSADQEVAWEKLQGWIARSDPYFVLRGFAGTGKTFLLQKLLSAAGSTSFKFTAPTNKAAKVLSQMVGRDAGTIHSLLGLRMVPHEEGMRLEYPRATPRVGRGTVVVIDEASMVGEELASFIDRARGQCHFRVLYVGDPAQLNPIGERFSPAWKAATQEANRAMLRQVMRFDNQLLNLSLRIRKRMREKRFESPIRDDHDSKGGVYLLSQHAFEKKLMRLKLADYETCKVIAWRNKTVDRYNKAIRKQLGFENTYEVGELLLLGEPIEIDGVIVGHTDEEGRVKSAELTKIEESGEDVEVWRIVMQADERVHTLNVPLKGDDTLPRILSGKASDARNAARSLDRKHLWDDFWKTKRRFHSVRYGYAMTAHRIQGSTLDRAFVDQEDILANQEQLEAFRALYVACTRPRFRLFTF